MADDSTFGGGLAPDLVSGGGEAVGSPSFGGGAAGVGTGTDVLPPNAQPTEGQAPGGFGSGLAMQPAQTQDPLDIAANALTQRVQRAEKASTGPAGILIQLFNPEAAAHNRALMTQGAEAIAKIRGQQATIAAGKVQASNLGLEPGAVSDYATQEQRVEVAKQRALKGDLRVFTGLQAVDPKTAEAIAPQVHEVMAGHLENAQYVYDKLSNMTTQGEYAAAVKEMQQTGRLNDMQSLGFKVPETLHDFNGGKALEGKALREARIHMNTLRTQLEERNTYQPMEKKEAETYTGRLTTATGDQITNGTWSRNAASGTRGFIVNGADDPRKLGQTFTLGNEEQRKALREEMDRAIPKDVLEKNREFDRTYKLATEDAKGNKIGDGKINTNPNVQQAVAEGLASMLRGGHGGANVGLLNIETGKRGTVQALIDKIATEWAGAWNNIEGKDANQYLTKLTEGQMRDVLDVVKAYNDKSIDERAAPVAERAGALGFKPSVFGFGDKDDAGAIGAAMGRGREAQIQRMMPYHQAIGGGDGVLQLGAQRPGAGASPMPPATQNNNQLPGATPVATPVQQARQPNGPGGSPPAAPGPSPAVTQPAVQGPAGGAAPVPPSGGSGPNAPAVTPPAADGSGGDGPGPRDPVAHAMEGVSGAVQSWLESTGAKPAAVQAAVVKVAQNPRVEKELEETGKVSGKTVAAALGKGGDKSLVKRFTEFMNEHFTQGVAGDQATKDKAVADVGNAAVEHAPAIGGALGGAVGTVAGPAGAVIGGAAGGGTGQALKDWIKGNDQDPVEIAKQTALGGVLGVGNMAARVVGAGVVEGGAALAEGKTPKEAVTEAGKGAGLAAGGEAFGRALGMAGHKLWNLFGAGAKQEIAGAAETLATARKTLETTEPKIAGATGAVDNPAYVKAEADVAKAEQTIKDAGLKPEEVEYAHKVSQDKVPTNEATVNRPGALEKENIGQGYQQQRAEVEAAGVGAPKPAPKLDDGPIALAASQKMAPAMRSAAERTEMAITAPAKSWGEKWEQLTKARSSLLELERDAASSTTAGRTQQAKDYRALADTVRAQQEKVAKYVFGEEGGKEFVKRLEVLDRRYAKLMDATNGGDMMAAAKFTGEKGREADKAFKAFAHDDPAAIATWNALRSRGSDIEKDVKNLVAAEKIPVLGHVFSAVKLLGSLNEWRAARAAGKPVQFSSFLGLDTNAGNKPARNVLGSMGARGAVQ